MKLPQIIILTLLIFTSTACVKASMLSPMEGEDGVLILQANAKGRIDLKYANQVSPGATIYLRGKIKSIRIVGMKGTAEQPITITNYPGETVTIGEPEWRGGAHSNAIQLLESKHVIIGGSDRASSFIIDGSMNGGYFGLSLQPFTDCIEVRNLTIRNCSNGIVAKLNPEQNKPSTYYPNTTLESLKIHDLEISNTDGEAMYIGHTSPFWGWDANGKGFNAGTDTTKANCTYVRPAMWNHIEIYNNKIENIYSAGIQVGASVNVEIYNNQINNFGIRSQGGHNMGIVIGNRCTNTKVYNNKVINGTGECMQFHGARSETGTHTIKNNLFVGSKSHGLYLFGLTTDGTVIDVQNNTIVNCTKNAIVVNGRHIVTLANITDNLMINCTADPAKLDRYMSSMNEGQIVSNKDNKFFRSVAEADVDPANNFVPRNNSSAGTAGYRP